MPVIPHQNMLSCLADFGRSMNMSGCFKASPMRRQAMSKYFGSISMPMNLRPSLTAATPVDFRPKISFRMIRQSER